MAWRHLRDQGRVVNRKRVQRLWREEGLRVPQRSRKRARVGISTIPADRLRAEALDQVWALDFQHDETADGRPLRLLHIVDEHSREALKIVVERHISADDTVKALEAVVAQRGRAPVFIRCDNGPELTAHALRDWRRFSGVATSYIEPGAPWENPFVESFCGTIRYELLSVELFGSLLEAKVMIEDWRHTYNTMRWHSSLGGMAPAVYTQMLRTEKQPA